VLPIINKIDLPAADVEGTKNSIVEQFEFDESEIQYISAKSGLNVD
jgi:GTP-binding protein LepA